MGKLGGFLLVVGVSIAALWMALLTTGRVPEIEQGRVDIWFHLAAELLTAAVLVVAGVMVLRRWAGASLVAGLALGALGYTAVNSAGYYAETGDWPTVGFFGAVVTATVLAVRGLLTAPPTAGAPEAPPAHAPSDAMTRDTATNGTTPDAGRAAASPRGGP